MGYNFIKGEIYEKNIIYLSFFIVTGVIYTIILNYIMPVVEQYKIPLSIPLIVFDVVMGIITGFLLRIVTLKNISDKKEILNLILNVMIGTILSILIMVATVTISLMLSLNKMN